MNQEDEKGIQQAFLNQSIKIQRIPLALLTRKQKNTLMSLRRWFKASSEVE